MARRLLTLIILVAVVMPMSAQSKQSIQGVWRVVEITITDSPAGSLFGQVRADRIPPRQGRHPRHLVTLGAFTNGAIPNFG